MAIKSFILVLFAVAVSAVAESEEPTGTVNLLAPCKPGEEGCDVLELRAATKQAKQNSKQKKDEAKAFGDKSATYATQTITKEGINKDVESGIELMRSKMQQTQDTAQKALSDAKQELDDELMIYSMHHSERMQAEKKAVGLKQAVLQKNIADLQEQIEANRGFFDKAKEIVTKWDLTAGLPLDITNGMPAAKGGDSS